MEQTSNSVWQQQESWSDSGADCRPAIWPRDWALDWWAGQSSSCTNEHLCHQQERFSRFVTRSSECHPHISQGIFRSGFNQKMLNFKCFMLVWSTFAADAKIIGVKCLLTCSDSWHVCLKNVSKSVKWLVVVTMLVSDFVTELCGSTCFTVSTVYWVYTVLSVNVIVPLNARSTAAAVHLLNAEVLRLRHIINVGGLD